MTSKYIHVNLAYHTKIELMCWSSFAFAWRTNEWPLKHNDREEDHGMFEYIR